MIRRLYAITSDYSIGFPAQLSRLLALGLERLDMELGIVSRVEGDQYQIVQSAGPEERPHPGDRMPLGETYCSITLTSDGPVSFHHVADSEAHLHPCHGKFGLEAYIGAPIVNRSGVFGTVNFSSVAPRPQPFRDVDVDVLQLMATWIGSELERRDLEQAVETIHGLIPICASCKRIRSNLGDWQAMEHYFSEQAQLSFTHGVCPHCVDELREEQARRAKGSS